MGLRYRVCGFALFLSHPMPLGIGDRRIRRCEDGSRLLEVVGDHDLSGCGVFSLEFIVFLWLFALWRYISLSQSLARTTIIDHRFHHFSPHIPPLAPCFIHPHFISTAAHR